MATNRRNRSYKNGKIKRTPYTGFEKTPKRDAKGHFIKQNNNGKEVKPNGGNNCYKTHKPVRANENEVQKREKNVETSNRSLSDIFTCINQVTDELVSNLVAHYNEKPIYSLSDMERVVLKTRNDVHEAMQKYYRKANRSCLSYGIAIGMVIGAVIATFGPSFINFAISLFA